MLNAFDNIVFDLGGVVLTLDYDLCVDNLRQIGLENAASLLDLYKQSGDFLALEEGRISAAQFLDILRPQCTPGVTDEQINLALNSFITGLPLNRLQALRELRKNGKKVYALSNTNPLMYNTIIAELFRGEGLEIDDYFDGQILSFRERICKPGADIFNRLLRRYNLDAERTLFLDDSAKNCHAAEELGIASALIPEGIDFMDILAVI